MRDLQYQRNNWKLARLKPVRPWPDWPDWPDWTLRAYGPVYDNKLALHDLGSTCTFF